MKDLQIFFIFYGVLLIQRFCELLIAKKNEKWIRANGAVEFGQKFYKYIVVMHIFFLLSLCGEKLIEDRNISSFWPLLLLVFICSQLLRVWSIFSLGKFWNTKIFVLPQANIVFKGPYRFIRHPNYLVVFLEIVTIPLLFNAYFTACLFTFLNIFLLGIRIPQEEKALKTLTEYGEIFEKRNRFIPSISKMTRE